MAASPNIKEIIPVQGSGAMMKTKEPAEYFAG